jgi:hypothetical protein
MSGRGIYAAVVLMCARAENGRDVVVHLECTTGLFDSQTEAHRAAIVAALENRPGMEVSKVEVVPVSNAAVLEHAETLKLAGHYQLIMGAIGSPDGIAERQLIKAIMGRLSVAEYEDALRTLQAAGLIWRAIRSPAGGGRPQMMIGLA